MFLRILAALLLILSASPALAQTDDDLPGPRECLDDDHTNRCDPEVQARVRALLGMASIEDEAASGAIIYRAFFVNGYGRDMPAIAFERRPGQSPEVVIYGFDGRSTRAPVSQEAWAQVVDQAEIADRVMEPLAPREDGAISICVHGWVQTVEIANAPRDRFGDETLRSRTESACGGGLTTRFAFWLADLAIDQIPWCSRLDPETQRNGVTRAATCLILSGDRMAAAELHNARLGNTRWRGGDDLTASGWRSRIGINSRAELTWGSQTIRPDTTPGDEIADFLVDRFAEHPGVEFYTYSVEGVGAHRVIVQGEAAFEQDGSLMVADYRQTWVWARNGLEWALAVLDVEDFAPHID